MLMDLFYKTISEEQKQRVHFHSFMLDIHASKYWSYNHSSVETNNAINECCVGVSTETVLQIDKLYTVVKRIVAQCNWMAKPLHYPTEWQNHSKMQVNGKTIAHLCHWMAKPLHNPIEW